MPSFVTLALMFLALGACLAVGVLIVHEIGRHRREMAARAILLRQADGLLHNAQCALCGGELSTWDRVLQPLPTKHSIAPPSAEPQSLVEYEVRRSCRGCRHEFVLWLWSDGRNWGFHQPDA